jgi:aconitate hydratase
LKLIGTIEALCTSGSPGDVVTVREVSGLAVNQVLGSSANPGLRDFWIVPDNKGNVSLKFLLMSIHLP